ncbi:MAG: peroxiredoxin [Dehalococcoidia bacterium]
MTLAYGHQAPDFTLETTEGEKTLAGMLQDGPAVLIFYTEDSTPTCTTQVCSFRDEFQTLRDLDATVLGISADSIESHRRFAEQQGIPFPLASDETLEVARKYDVVAEDGKRARRAVFVVREDGTILAANDHYQPADMNQFAEVFAALGNEPDE